MRIRVIRRTGEALSQPVVQDATGWPFPEPAVCVLDEAAGAQSIVLGASGALSIPLDPGVLLELEGRPFAFDGPVVLASDGRVPSAFRTPEERRARVFSLLISPDLVEATAQQAGVVPTRSFLPDWVRARTVYAAVRDVADLCLRTREDSVVDYGLCERIAVDLHGQQAPRYSYMAKCAGGTLDDKLDRLRRLQWAVCAVDAGAFRQVDLAFLAELARMSKWHFARVFGEVFGETAYSYVTRRRCDYAIELLQNTLLPIAAIATELGFKDRNGFGLFMRQRLGCSPRRFRMRALGARSVQHRLMQAAAVERS